MDKIIPHSENEKKEWPSSVIINLPEAFCDIRGSIQPLLDVDMKSSVLIISNAGSVRANHYHKTDWHYCYVLSGEIKYYYRPHGDKKLAKELIIKENQMFFTPPMVDHAMVFDKKTKFLTWSRNSRLQEFYEADVFRIAPINP
ncbi:cupin domain-containing protein [Prochlorococcus marinus]|uniref:cupin domain-containing protein n=1 Tax=Prochlorococcus marinus TaxID=1219 RepID=UPI0022B53183|nr:cupin domain-containing protein [Prochlorococcus marinus]